MSEQVVSLDKLKRIAEFERWKANHAPNNEAKKGFATRAEVIEQLVEELEAELDDAVGS